MTNKRISDLPAVTSAEDTDEFPIVRSSTTYKQTYANLAAAVTPSYPIAVANGGTGATTAAAARTALTILEETAITLAVDQSLASTASPTFDLMNTTGYVRVLEQAESALTLDAQGALAHVSDGNNGVRSLAVELGSISPNYKRIPIGWSVSASGAAQSYGDGPPVVSPPPPPPAPL